jgi:hypothetical protein
LIRNIEGRSGLAPGVDNQSSTGGSTAIGRSEVTELALDRRFDDNEESQLVQIANHASSGLTDDDFALLRQSFITRDLVDAAGLFRVDDLRGSEILGRSRKADVSYAGIVFPHFAAPDYSRATEYCIRRDLPEFERRGNDETKPKGKYLWPACARNRFYFPPGVTQQILGDTTLPLVITEGPKKLLACYRLAIEGTEGHRFLPIGLSGVWNFRGTVGITTTSAGRKAKLKGAIPDFEKIAWAGRIVYILFDSNVQTNAKVRSAEIALAKELMRREAKVFLARLPNDCNVNGIDDYLGLIEGSSGIDDAVAAGLSILEKAKPARVERQSQADRLVAVAEENFELFHTSDGECFVSFEIGGHLETHRTSTKAFKGYLARQFHEEEGKAPSSQALKDAITILDSEARWYGLEKQVHIRVASHGGNIYIDLCDPDWQVVEVTKNGYSVISSRECPVRFRRTKSMQPLPIPDFRGGSVKELRSFLNTGPGDDKLSAFVLLVCWLANCFRPDYPFPILILEGEPGTGKSTITWLIKELIDPSLVPHRSCPRNEQDLMIAAKHSWLCSFDNVSNVPDWQSDAFCRLSTGGGLGTRTLYENDDETILTAKRPIILNGIGNFASRSDLVDRSLVIHLNVIPHVKRRSEREFRSEFEAKKQAIFSGLLSGVSAALRNLGNVSIGELPRMADFAEWATASEPGLGFESGDFLKAYSKSRADSHAIVLEGSAVAETLLDHCAEKGNFTSELLLKDLLQLLKTKASEKGRDKALPKSPKGLRNELQRINPNLREIGITVEFLGKTGANASKGASVRLDYKPEETSQTSLTSEVNKKSASER